MPTVCQTAHEYQLNGNAPANFFNVFEKNRNMVQLGDVIKSKYNLLII